jgi:hypothetical protein
MNARSARVLDAAADIAQTATPAADIAYMARELVQCTLPHRDPGDVACWRRTNGHLTLSITSHFGYPFGSYPRVLLFWLTRQAIRTGRRTLILGESYNAFLRDLGMSTNGGPRGAATGVTHQARRLFGSSITFAVGPAPASSRWMNMPVADSLGPLPTTLWTPRRVLDGDEEHLEVELGERFFEALHEHPVPLDWRAVKALQQSPLALDLYAWATHRSFIVSRTGEPAFCTWRGLANQFGGGHGPVKTREEVKEFKRRAHALLPDILAVYPGLRLQSVPLGLEIRPESRPAVLPVAPVGQLRLL